MAAPCKTNSYLPPPLCKNDDIRRWRKWLVLPLRKVNFGKCVKPQGHDEIGERRPYLRLHGVAESADETLDAQ